MKHPRSHSRVARRGLATLAVLAASACGGHRHGPNRADDPRHLYVELFADSDALHDGARTALSRIPYVVVATSNGDVELQLEVPRLESGRRQTECRVKILVLRLPQHDLLGIADAGARADGTGGGARDQCVTMAAAALVRGKLRTLLDRRLRDKR